MRHDIFNLETRQQLEQRIDRITDHSVPLWGQMNAAEMLYHCKQALRVIMHAEPSQKTSTLRQKLSKFVFLHLKSTFPKGIKTPVPLDVKKMKVVIHDLELEKRELKQVMELFSMQQNIHAVHPYFGKLSRSEWGIFSYKHLDHHLRQFNV